MAIRLLRNNIHQKMLGDFFLSFFFEHSIPPKQYFYETKNNSIIMIRLIAKTKATIKNDENSHSSTIQNKHNSLIELKNNF